MKDPQELLNRALDLVDLHLAQIHKETTVSDEKGKTKALTAYDSQVIERYSKLLITLTKKTDPNADLDGLTEAELEAIANGQDNAPTEMGDTE